MPSSSLVFATALSLLPYFPTWAVILDHAASAAKSVIERGKRGGNGGLGAEDVRAERGFGEAGGEGGVPLGVGPAAFGADGEDGAGRLLFTHYYRSQRWCGVRFGKENLKNRRKI